ncbi:glucan biosynthesis protein G [Opitutaceae bacterium TAV5]|nr:glucan biosynthesis protein G [Opitutaceae bacterium TAV5]
MTTSGPRLLFSRLAACVLFAGCLLLLPSAARAAIEKAEITFDTIRELAARRAASAWKAPDVELPSGLAALDYDQNRKIRFIPEKALWREENLPFNLQLFHRTSARRERVTISEFSPTHVQDIPFIREFFDYGDLKNLGWIRSSLGYAGFRIHYPLNRPEVYDELLVFLGASYFRALGAGQIYGLSARGLAVDTGIIGQPEEFPMFTDFWLGKPKPGAKTLTIYAILDSRSVAGAYEFIVTPGKPTVIDVRTELRFRSAVELPGIAPLTSMFWFGENTDRPAGEPRPEVHDSDGLFVEDKNTHAWRPLSNPRIIVSTDIALDNPVRFGLLQRDRAVSSYEDFEALYHQRPSVWIEPKGDWGRGKVRLVELPTGDEYADNIVAFWVPESKPLPGRPVLYSYRMTWALSEPKADPPLAHVAATRTGALPGDAQGRLIWVDFAGGQLEGIEADKITAKVEASAGGKILSQTLVRHPGLKGWRVVLQVERGPELANDGTIELRCQLLNGYDPLSETWLYSWTP